MTNKQKYLDSLKAKIDVFTTAYEAIKNLPDSFFDEMHFGVPQHEISVIKLAKPSEDSYQKALDIAHGNDWGRNKRLVLEILRKSNKPLLKQEIIDQYALLSSNEAPHASVTYAITALQNDEKIKGYKPDGVKFRGFLWTLSEWWDGENIKKQYEVEKRSLFHQ